MKQRGVKARTTTREPDAWRHMNTVPKRRLVVVLFDLNEGPTPIVVRFSKRGSGNPRMVWRAVDAARYSDDFALGWCPLPSKALTDVLRGASRAKAAAKPKRG